MTNSVDQDQTSPTAASDKVINCLLMKCYVII